MRCIGWREWTVLALIAVAVAALLLPGPKWASSGEIRIPVRVVVFDAETLSPIADAMVAIVRVPPAPGEFEPKAYADQFSATWSAFDRGEIRTRTLADGSVAIPTDFGTGASHTNPEPRAHTRWHWVLVAVNGYGRVAIPLRYESMSTAQLRRDGLLTAAVGLSRDVEKSD